MILFFCSHVVTGVAVRNGVKVGFRYGAADHNLHGRKAILLISPCQRYYMEDDLFAAIIALINKTDFKSVDIVLGDTNNQYNLMAQGATQADAYAIAKAQGDKWLSEKSLYIDNLKAKHSLTRWEYWVNHPLYAKCRQEIEKEFLSNKQFKDAFCSSAMDFVRRVSDDHPYDFEDIPQYQYSIEYLKEECAIIMPLWAKLGYEYIIYPAPMLAAMEATRNTMVLPHYGQSRAAWLHLRYKRYERNQPSAYISKRHLVKENAALC